MSDVCDGGADTRTQLYSVEVAVPLSVMPLALFVRSVNTRTVKQKRIYSQVRLTPKVLTRFHAAAERSTFARRAVSFPQECKRMLDIRRTFSK